METRKVTIINSKTQTQKVIKESTATTLGELKSEMRSAGIDYKGMTFFEGHIRAELKDDASILPSNINYKGQIVNDLVFMLTTPNKKVASGMDRKEAYNKIKELNLQDTCKSVLGRNYTQCPTDALIALINSYNDNKKSDNVECEQEAPCCCNTDKNVQNNTSDNFVKAFEVLLEELYKDDIIDEYIYDKIKAVITGKECPKDTKMCQKEIDEMFNFI